jgi:RNA polymerase sigma factor (sigma-70 family)
MKKVVPQSQDDWAAQIDEELMVAYQAGHEEAFQVLYARHSAKVYGFLSARLRDRATADDAFQATFLKLHRSRGKYDSNLPFAPWLFTICRSAMLDTIRARNRISAKESLDEIALEATATPVVSEAVSLPDLGTLPSGQRQALELRYKDDLSFEEIATRLKTTPENTRQLVSRAIRKLKNLVQGEEK